MSRDTHGVHRANTARAGRKQKTSNNVIVLAVKGVCMDLGTTCKSGGVILLFRVIVFLSSIAHCQEMTPSATQSTKMTPSLQAIPRLPTLKPSLSRVHGVSVADSHTKLQLDTAYTAATTPYDKSLATISKPLASDKTYADDNVYITVDSTLRRREQVESRIFQPTNRPSTNYLFSSELMIDSASSRLAPAFKTVALRASSSVVDSPSKSSDLSPSSVDFSATVSILHAESAILSSTDIKHPGNTEFVKNVTEMSAAQNVYNINNSNSAMTLMPSLVHSLITSPPKYIASNTFPPESVTRITGVDRGTILDERSVEPSFSEVAEVTRIYSAVIDGPLFSTVEGNTVPPHNVVDTSISQARFSTVFQHPLLESETIMQPTSNFDASGATQWSLPSQSIPTASLHRDLRTISLYDIPTSHVNNDVRNSIHSLLSASQLPSNEPLSSDLLKTASGMEFVSSQTHDIIITPVSTNVHSNSVITTRNVSSMQSPRTSNNDLLTLARQSDIITSSSRIVYTIGDTASRYRPHSEASELFDFTTLISTPTIAFQQTSFTEIQDTPSLCTSCYGTTATSIEQVTAPLNINTMIKSDFEIRTSISVTDMPLTPPAYYTDNDVTVTPSKFTDSRSSVYATDVLPSERMTTNSEANASNTVNESVYFPSNVSLNSVVVKPTATIGDTALSTDDKTASLSSGFVGEIGLSMMIFQSAYESVPSTPFYVRATDTVLHSGALQPFTSTIILEPSLTMPFERSFNTYPNPPLSTSTMYATHYGMASSYLADSQPIRVMPSKTISPEDNTLSARNGNISWSAYETSVSSYYDIISSSIISTSDQKLTSASITDIHFDRTNRFNDSLHNATLYNYSATPVPYDYDMTTPLYNFTNTTSLPFYYNMTSPVYSLTNRTFLPFNYDMTNPLYNITNATYLPFDYNTTTLTYNLTNMSSLPFDYNITTPLYSLTNTTSLPFDYNMTTPLYNLTNTMSLQFDYNMTIPLYNPTNATHLPIDYNITTPLYNLTNMTFSPFDYNMTNTMYNITNTTLLPFGYNATTQLYNLTNTTYLPIDYNMTTAEYNLTNTTFLPFDYNITTMAYNFTNTISLPFEYNTTTQLYNTTYLPFDYNMTNMAYNLTNTTSLPLDYNMTTLLYNLTNTTYLPFDHNTTTPLYNITNTTYVPFDYNMTTALYNLINRTYIPFDYNMTTPLYELISTTPVSVDYNVTAPLHKLTNTTTLPFDYNMTTPLHIVTNTTYLPFVYNVTTPLYNLTNTTFLQFENNMTTSLYNLINTTYLPFDYNGTTPMYNLTNTTYLQFNYTVTSPAYNLSKTTNLPFDYNMTTSLYNLTNTTSLPFDYNGTTSAYHLINTTFLPFDYNMTTPLYNLTNTTYLPFDNNGTTPAYNFTNTTILPFDYNVTTPLYNLTNTTYLPFDFNGTTPAHNLTNTTFLPFDYNMTTPLYNLINTTSLPFDYNGTTPAYTLTNATFLPFDYNGTTPAYNLTSTTSLLFDYNITTSAYNLTNTTSLPFDYNVTTSAFNLTNTTSLPFDYNMTTPANNLINTSLPLDYNGTTPVYNLTNTTSLPVYYNMTTLLYNLSNTTYSPFDHYNMTTSTYNVTNTTSLPLDYNMTTPLYYLTNITSSPHADNNSTVSQPVQTTDTSSTTVAIVTSDQLLSMQIKPLYGYDIKDTNYIEKLELGLLAAFLVASQRSCDDRGRCKRALVRIRMPPNPKSVSAKITSTSNQPDGAVSLTFYVSEESGQPLHAAIASDVYSELDSAELSAYVGAQVLRAPHPYVAAVPARGATWWIITITILLAALALMTVAIGILWLKQNRKHQICIEEPPEDYDRQPCTVTHLAPRVSMETDNDIALVTRAEHAVRAERLHRKLKRFERLRGEPKYEPTMVRYKKRACLHESKRVSRLINDEEYTQSESESQTRADDTGDHVMQLDDQWARKGQKLVRFESDDPRSLTDTTLESSPPNKQENMCNGNTDAEEEGGNKTKLTSLISMPKADSIKRKGWRKIKSVKSSPVYGENNGTLEMSTIPNGKAVSGPKRTANGIRLVPTSSWKTRNGSILQLSVPQRRLVAKEYDSTSATSMESDATNNANSFEHVVKMSHMTDSPKSLSMGVMTIPPVRFRTSVHPLASLPESVSTPIPAPPHRPANDIAQNDAITVKTSQHTECRPKNDSRLESDNENKNLLHQEKRQDKYEKETDDRKSNREVSKRVKKKKKKRVKTRREERAAWERAQAGVEAVVQPTNNGAVCNSTTPLKTRLDSDGHISDVHKDGNNGKPGRNMRAVPRRGSRSGQETDDPSAQRINERNQELLARLKEERDQQEERVHLRKLAQELINDAYLEHELKAQHSQRLQQQKVDEMLNEAFPLATNGTHHAAPKGTSHSAPYSPAADHVTGSRGGRRRAASAAGAHTGLLERLYNGVSLRKLNHFAGSHVGSDLQSSPVGSKRGKPRTVWTSPGGAANRYADVCVSDAEKEALQKALCIELQQLKPDTYD